MNSMKSEASVCEAETRLFYNMTPTQHNLVNIIWKNSLHVCEALLEQSVTKHSKNLE